MGKVAIRIDNIGKQYNIGSKQQFRKTFRETVTDTLIAPFRKSANLLRGNIDSANELTETIWALQGISFTVNHGDVVGIIGRNGAGKTTLLKILSRITEPSAGSIDLYGRVGALLEVGTGFHSELTGRENIYLSGAILGMTRAEIDRKFDEIVDFSGVEQFIDTPIKHFSSGMNLRLGFAVAAHLEPEILLVDEVLAVGDSAFQKKCLGKMNDVAQAGRTVLFVSHNMATVKQLCHYSIVLHDGGIAYQGDIDEAIAYYTDLSSQKIVRDLADRTDRYGNGTIQVEKIVFEDAIGNTVTTLRSGNSATIKAYYRLNQAEPVKNVSVMFRFEELSGELLFSVDTEFTGANIEQISRNGFFACTIPSLQLMPGIYSVYILVKNNGQTADLVKDALQFTVDEDDFYGTGKFPILQEAW